MFTWAEESKRKINWSQRIAVAIGIAKGIQFLHTWIMPGLYKNNLKITDILVDYNFIAKISHYNLPLLSNNTGKKVSENISSFVWFLDKISVIVIDLCFLLQVIQGISCSGSKPGINARSVTKIQSCVNRQYLMLSTMWKCFHSLPFNTFTVWL